MTVREGLRRLPEFIAETMADIKSALVERSIHSDIKALHEVVEKIAEDAETDEELLEYLTRNATVFESEALENTGNEVSRFAGDSGWEEVRLPNLKKIDSYGFYQNKTLRIAELGSLILGEHLSTPSSSAAASNLFYGCANLENVKLGGIKALSREFAGCSRIRRLDLGNCETIEFNNGVPNARIIILRKSDGVVATTGVPSGYPVFYGLTFAQQNVNADWLGPCGIFVPRALVDSYKVAEGWSPLADYIYAIEDNPYICEPDGYTANAQGCKFYMKAKLNAGEDYSYRCFVDAIDCSANLYYGTPPYNVLMKLTIGGVEQDRTPTETVLGSNRLYDQVYRYTLGLWPSVAGEAVFTVHIEDATGAVQEGEFRANIIPLTVNFTMKANRGTEDAPVYDGQPYKIVFTPSLGNYFLTLASTWKYYVDGVLVTARWEGITEAGYHDIRIEPSDEYSSGIVVGTIEQTLADSSLAVSSKFYIAPASS